MSLQIVFAVVLGGMYTLLEPTVGTAITIALAEYLRVVFGVKLLGMADRIFVIRLPPYRSAAGPLVPLRSGEDALTRAPGGERRDPLPHPAKSSRGSAA